MVPMSAWIGVSAALFAIGLFAILTRRNAVAVFMGIEIVLNAANINFVAFARNANANMDGIIMAIFVIMLAAAEFAVALALILGMYQTLETVQVDEVKELKG